MSNFSASIPVAQMQAANDLLSNKAGTEGAPNYGPNNFSVPAYAGANPTHALLHSWGDAVFEAAVAAIPGVVIQQGIVTVNPGFADSVNENPVAMTTKVAETVGAGWSQSAKPLTGTVTPGLYYDTAKVMWWVIQSYNTATYPNPAVIPALIRKVREPGVAAPWVQPIDQYDAYKLLNPFTGKPDTCTYGGFTWKVTQADGSGNNVWQPGVFGWTKA